MKPQFTTGERFDVRTRPRTQDDAKTKTIRVAADDIAEACRSMRGEIGRHERDGWRVGRPVIMPRSAEEQQALREIAARLLACHVPCVRVEKTERGRFLVAELTRL